MEPQNDGNRLSIFKRQARILSLLAMFLIITAIPFTVYVAQQRQDIRQRAAWDGGWGLPSLPPRHLSITPSISQAITLTPTATSIPTLSPTSTLTPTGTITLTPSPTGIISPTSSLSPTVTSSVSPTPTTTAGGTQLAFELVLAGVGPNGGNQSPKKQGREFKIQVFDINNREVANKSGNLTFDPQSQTFKGTIDLGSLSSVLGDKVIAQWGGWGDWNITRHPSSPTPTQTAATPTITPTPTNRPSVTPTSPPSGGTGNYIVKVKTKRYLRKIINGVTTLNIGTLNQMPVTTLVVGDINDDNKLTIEDYNILVGCFGSKADSSSCSDKENADLDDNEAIDGVDLNLFLRSLSTQEGD